MFRPQRCFQLRASGGRSTRERKAAFERYVRTGVGSGLELKAGLSEGGSGGYVTPPETERMIDRRLAMASPMRQIATVRTIGATTGYKCSASHRTPGLNQILRLRSATFRHSATLIVRQFTLAAIAARESRV